jgi:hypothetical protein
MAWATEPGMARGRAILQQATGQLTKHGIGARELRLVNWRALIGGQAGVGVPSTFGSPIDSLVLGTAQDRADDAAQMSAPKSLRSPLISHKLGRGVPELVGPLSFANAISIPKTVNRCQSP